MAGMVVVLVVLQDDIDSKDEGAPSNSFLTLVCEGSEGEVA
jgi:hypothetical protein